MGVNPSVVEHDTFKKSEMHFKNIKQEIKTKIQTQDMFLKSEKPGSKLMNLENLNPLFPKVLFRVSILLAL